MRAILIDSVKKTVTEIELEGDFLQGAYKALRCDTIAIVGGHDLNDDILVDDEALLSERTPEHGWCALMGQTQPVCGSMLIVGSNDEGETVGATTPLGHIKKLAAFMTEEDVAKWVKRQSINPFRVTITGQDGDTEVLHEFSLSRRT